MLEAIDVCQMEITKTNTLTIGNLYHINDIYENSINIIDDQGYYHDFTIEELPKVFKIPNKDPKTMTIKEKKQ